MKTKSTGKFEKAYLEYIKNPTDDNFAEFVKLADAYITGWCKNKKFWGHELKNVKQEIYKKLWKDSSYYDLERGEITAYIKIIIKAAIANYTAKLGRQKRKLNSEALSLDKPISIDYEDFTLKDIIADPKDKEENLTNKELMSILFSQLSLMEKKILVSALENQKLDCIHWSLKDIADSTEYTVKQIDNAKKRIQLKADDVYRRCYNAEETS